MKLKSKNFKDDEQEEVIEEVVVKSQPIEESEQEALEKTAEKSNASGDGDSTESEKSVQVKKIPMLERKKSRDDITFQSGWRKVVKLMDLAKARLITEETIVELETEEVTFFKF